MLTKQERCTMNKLFYVALLSTFILISCSNKIPTLNSSENGIIAITVEAKNNTSYNISRYYKVFSTIDSEVEMTIYPKIGTSYAFSKELPPGKYYIDKCSSIGKGVDVYSSRNKNTWSISGLIVEVQPATVTIANKVLTIEQTPTGPHSWIVNANFEPISDDEMRVHIEELGKLDENNSWKIADLQ